jgi:hypothetical protein
MRIAGRGQGRLSSASRKNRYKKRIFTRRNQRGKASTKKEIPRRGAKTAERQSNLYRLETLCALSVFAREKTVTEKHDWIDTLTPLLPYRLFHRLFLRYTLFSSVEKSLRGEGLQNNGRQNNWESRFLQIGKSSGSPATQSPQATHPTLAAVKMRIAGELLGLYASGNHHR